MLAALGGQLRLVDPKQVAAWVNSCQGDHPARKVKQCLTQW